MMEKLRETRKIGHKDLKKKKKNVHASTTRKEQRKIKTLGKRREKGKGRTKRNKEKGK